MARNTVQKTKILENLRGRHDHPSAGEVYQSLKSDLPHISLATVYRNLEDLANRGDILRLKFGDITRFDGNISKHSHVICKECGAIEDLPQPAMNRTLANLQSKSTFAIEDLELKLTGLCPNCKISQ